MLFKREQFLPTITTSHGYDWQRKIAEIDQLNLQKVAVFPTCLEKLPERQELYRLLEGTKLKSIPFVHLRSNMEPWELDYFVKRWQTEVFNTHPQKEFPIQYDWSEYLGKIFIENVYTPFDQAEIEKFAGLCLDLSHLENDRLLKSARYQKNLAALGQFKIGCNHISDIQPVLQKDEYDSGADIYSTHLAKSFSNFDYLKKYSANYFSPFCAIEIVNPLAEQLKIIGYILTF